MQHIHSIQSMQQISDQLRQAGKRIAFVPTMGALHAGHMCLCAEAQKYGDSVVVSIFVNPLQFGPREDFIRYPRPIEHDCALCEQHNVDVVFAPVAEDMYLSDFSTTVEELILSRPLCGACRPGHFKGVATVVLKLLHIVNPHVMLLGQKDAQQLLVIKRMVRDLNMPVEIVEVETAREQDGLALSSRNRYLSSQERAIAASVPQALRKAQEMIQAGERNPQIIRAAIAGILQHSPAVTIQYISLCNRDTLEEVSLVQGRMMCALAVYINKIRLIDNIQFEV